MKRNIKKALAFALATVTVAANLGGYVPAIAAEYDEVKDVLPAEYEDYVPFNDGILFPKTVQVENANGIEMPYLGEVAFVDKNGEKSTLEVKNADGSYKYTHLSYVSNECVALGQYGGTYALYMADGTIIGNGTERYKEMAVLFDGNILAANDTACNLLDKTGKVIVKDIFTPVEFDWIYWWPCFKFGDYYVLGREYYGGENSDGVYEAKLFDKNYKPVTGINLTDYNVGRVSDYYLTLSTGKEMTFYDMNLKKLDYVFKKEVVTNPSASTDGESVLVDYEISGAWKIHDSKGNRDIIQIGVYCYYEDALGNQSSGYEYTYLDVKTFAEIPEKDLQSGNADEYEEVHNTDVTYKYNNGIIEFYKGTTKLFGMDELVDFIIEKKSLTNNASIGLNVFGGANGDMYLGMSSWGDGSDEVYYALVLKKADGYSLEKATVLDKRLTGVSWLSSGVIYFSDGTKIFNGKTYDEYVEIRERGYDYLTGECRYYTITTCDKDYKVVSCVLYDKYDVEVAKFTEEAIWVTKNGHVVTAKDITDENGYSWRKYGCKYFKKTLVSSQDVIDELTSIEEGESVEVEIKKNDPIKSEIFETIKGKDVNVVVKMENGMSWKINGKNVKGDKLVDIDLTVDVVKDVVPAAAIDKIALKGERIELSLAHTGDFGFQAELKMNVKAENAGKFANRFFYNPETKALEFQEAVKVDANGDAAFTYTHASDYVIILSDAAYDVTTTPQTSDMTNVGMLIAFLAVAAGAVVFTQKKRVSVK